MGVKVGNIPLSEVKSMRQVMWALFFYKGPESEPTTLWEKLAVAWLLIHCRYVAWKVGKDLQATLKALVLAVEEMKREDAEHDF